jgi:diphthamide biosynthesis protein 2
MEYAEIQRFVNGNSNSGDCIALQLSDRLLFQSVEIIKNLDRARNAFVVLGDTSFGSCCVDEIAAMHGNAKAIVHFGYACLSRNNRLPVFYAFGREELDLDVRKIAGLAEEWEAVVLDQCFLYMEAEIKQQMVNVKRFGRDGLSKDQRGKVLFVQSREFGQDGSPLLKDLMLNFANYEFFVYRNDTKEVSENPAEPVRKWLMRRYYLIEKAKDAQIIGIIAGTLVVDRYMEMIDRVKMLIRKAKKVCVDDEQGNLNLSFCFRNIIFC